MDEALIIKPGYATTDRGKQATKKSPVASTQMTLALEKRGVYSEQ